MKALLTSVVAIAVLGSLIAGWAFEAFGPDGLPYTMGAIFALFVAAEVFVFAGAGAAFFSFSSPGLTGDGRASSPRRCALPITALRLTPPSSSAIWLAVDPPSHIFVRVAIRSSVQLIG